ncbi:MAG: hypothetical protein ACP5M7_09465 [Thermoproteota archaeon]
MILRVWFLAKKLTVSIYPLRETFYADEVHIHHNGTSRKITKKTLRDDEEYIIVIKEIKKTIENKKVIVEAFE